mmetsp:Transcript_65688/g.150594  ORF Transcript_65688/g.150594 Transcript_65688/m.150594 type:complete len:219 (+) Transcript_65688:374-1030(+)
MVPAQVLLAQHRVPKNRVDQDNAGVPVFHVQQKLLQHLQHLVFQVVLRDNSMVHLQIKTGPAQSGQKHSSVVVALWRPSRIRHRKCVLPVAVQRYQVKTLAGEIWDTEQVDVLSCQEHSRNLSFHRMGNHSRYEVIEMGFGYLLPKHVNKRLILWRPSKMRQLEAPELVAIGMKIPRMHRITRPRSQLQCVEKPTGRTARHPHKHQLPDSGYVRWPRQ